MLRARQALAVLRAQPWGWGMVPLDLALCWEVQLETLGSPAFPAFPAWQGQAAGQGQARGQVPDLGPIRGGLSGQRYLFQDQASSVAPRQYSVHEGRISPGFCPRGMDKDMSEDRAGLSRAEVN